MRWHEFVCVLPLCIEGGGSHFPPAHLRNCTSCPISISSEVLISGCLFSADCWSRLGSRADNCGRASLAFASKSIRIRIDIEVISGMSDIVKLAPGSDWASSNGRELGATCWASFPLRRRHLIALSSWAALRDAPCRGLLHNHHLTYFS